MARSRKLFTVGAVGVAAVALLAATAGGTGAYFSESAPGTITGTIGGVHLNVPTKDFNWTNMMPGEAQSATVGFTNTGATNEDFWVTFPNGPALHALNNLGTYGEVHVVDTNNAAVFDSINLDDGRTHLGTNSCGNIFSPTGCNPLPEMLKVASNVPPTGNGSFKFSFNYASKLTSGQGGAFNIWPSVTTNASPGSQAFDNSGTGGPNDVGSTTGAGLPYDVVAVQVGQTP